MPETQGEVVQFSIANRRGQIRVKQEGVYRFYSFDYGNWDTPNTDPAAGVAVQFQVEGDLATHIHAIPDTSSDPLDAIKKRLDVFSVASGSLLAILAFVLGNAFVVFPNLKPVTERAVTVSAVSVEPGVKFGEYLKHTTRRLVPEKPESCVQRLRESLATPSATAQPTSVASATPGPSPVIIDEEPGLSIHFTFTASGFVGECVVSQSAVFDGVTGRRVANNSNIVVEQPWETNLRDADTASGELWVPEAMVQGLESIVARVELYAYSEGKIQPLTYADSVKLCLPQALPCTSPSPSS